MTLRKTCAGRPGLYFGRPPQLVRNRVHAVTERAEAEARASFFRVDDLSPGVVRIELAHARGNAPCPRAEVLLEPVAIIVDDEGHDAGLAVLRRIGHEPEPADHVAANDVFDGAARGVRSLTGQYLVVVAVIGFAGANAITLLRRSRDRFAEWTVRFATRRRPVQAILLAGRADDLLRIDRLTGLVLAHVGVFILRV